MTRRPKPAFYRSEFTRWLFALTGLIAGFSVSPWGPREWRDTPSLRLIHSVIPWPVMALLFAVYVALLLTGRLEAVIAAYLLGMGLYLTATSALTLTIRTDLPANIILWCAGVLAVGYHYMAARLAFLQQTVDR